MLLSSLRIIGGIKDIYVKHTFSKTEPGSRAHLGLGAEVFVLNKKVVTIVLQRSPAKP